MNDEKDYLKNLYQKLRRSIQEERMENLLLNDSQINYSPSYQRNYIWNNTKAIKLIETILINGEVPPLTVIKINNTIEIIDGRQRYETLLKFYNDKLILRFFGLSVLKELDGLTYSKLPKNVKRRFDEYKLKMITYTIENNIDFNENDIDLIKRNLFRKYNYGMTALSKSEVARAKYLYDELTIQMRDYFHENIVDYDLCSNLFLPITKRNSPKSKRIRTTTKENFERDKMNLLLMNVRELLSIPYIPIIGLKTVKLGTSVIEKYYDKFVKQEDLTDKKEEFIKISKVLSKIKQELKHNNNSLQENILFFKSVYWMLSILYKVYPTSFYNFDIELFVHYLEGKNNAAEYFNNYKSLNSVNIINRHNYVKNYITEELNLNIDKYLLDIQDNPKIVCYKRKEKLIADDNWLGLGNTEQIVTHNDRFTINEIIKYIKENRFIIRPIYQRGEVKSIEKASKIIESLILGIKLPPIYLTAKEDENSLFKYTVIDGQQRLISILKYIGEEITDENFDYINTFKRNYNLKGLKDLKYLNGKSYEGENQLNKNYKDVIDNYKIDAIVIYEKENSKFDAVDMFLRLNENPCTIGKNSFEMWNSFNITKVIDITKDIAKYSLFKQNGNKMKEEELVIVLAYMIKKGITINNCSNFFKVHLYTENKDKNNERIEVKLSISNKNEITDYLEEMQPNSQEEQHFIDCLQKVRLLVEKLKILSDNDNEVLIKLFNPYLSVARKGNMKDFYIVQLFLQNIDKHTISTYKVNILKDLESIFKVMKSMPKGKNVEYFIDYIEPIINNYKIF